MSPEADGGNGLRLRERLREVDPLELCLRLLLLALLLDSPGHWYHRVPVVLLAGGGLLLPGAVRSRTLWAGLTALTAVPLLGNWPFSDNHDYLRVLTCLAVAASLGATDPRRALAWNARWLVGLLFAFAVLWKGVLSPDFVDGRFFRVTLLSDSRFHDLALLAGGASAASLEGFEAEISAAWRPDGGAAAEPGFREPQALGRLAVFLTAFTLLSEGAIALCFLWPGAGLPRRSRNLALQLFAVATYSFATVRGFGWLLMVLGAAQCEPRESRARWAYVALFALIELYRSVPWSEALVRWLGAG